MRQVTASGKTVEEAIETALQQLQVPKEQVSIQVIDEGKRGLFGIFGATRAVVKVTLKAETSAEDTTPDFEEVSNSEEVDHDSQQVTEEEPQSVTESAKQDETDREKEEKARIEEAKEYIINVAKEMDVSDVTVDVKVTGRSAYFELSSEKIARLIGKRGQTLNALQTLVQLVINKENQRFYHVMLDAENYRSKRKETLHDLANRMANRATKIKKKVALEPMPSFERKIIHKTLENRQEVLTKSEGRDPHRHIVIEPNETRK